MKQILLVLLFTPFIPGFQLRDRPIHIFMIGDSTMADKDPKSEPERGWGQALPEKDFLRPVQLSFWNINESTIL